MFDKETGKKKKSQPERF